MWLPVEKLDIMYIFTLRICRNFQILSYAYRLEKE